MNSGSRAGRRGNSTAQAESRAEQSKDGVSLSDRWSKKVERSTQSRNGVCGSNYASPQGPDYSAARLRTPGPDHQNPTAAPWRLSDANRGGTARARRAETVVTATVNKSPRRSKGSLSSRLQFSAIFVFSFLLVLGASSTPEAGRLMPSFVGFRTSLAVSPCDTRH